MKIRIDNPKFVIGAGTGTVALIAVIIFMCGGAPSSPLVTAGSILAVLGSTAGAGFAIFRTVERDRARALTTPGICPKCRRGTHQTYRGGRATWVHNIGDTEECWRPRYRDHEVLPVPISPGRPR